MDRICDDLIDETAALAAIVEPLSEEQWRQPTVAEGWDTVETVLHLGASDVVTTMAILEPERFAVERKSLATGATSIHELGGIDTSELSGAEMWTWFAERRERMIAGLRSLDPRQRLVWLGPDIGARSLATSRLLETWSHAHDLADTFGVSYPATARLRHLAHIGVVTRAFSYQNRGLETPSDPVRVELTGPDGEVWAWGPDDADAWVRGDAEAFCRVITRRVPFDDSTLHTGGTLAEEWMRIAQPWIEPERISDRA